jgi:tetratricopeptide (TPR) repeat protein
MNLRTFSLITLLALFIISGCKSQTATSPSNAACVLVDDGHFAEAVPLLQNLIAKTPDDPLLLRYYGLALRANVDTNETAEQSCLRMRRAIATWKKWLTIDTTTEGLVGVGSWSSWIGEYDTALVYLKKSIDHLPRDSKHMAGEEEYYIGQTFFLMKQQDSSDVYLQIAAKKGYPAFPYTLVPNPCKLAELLNEYKDVIDKRMELSKKSAATFEPSFSESAKVDSTIK